MKSIIKIVLLILSSFFIGFNTNSPKKQPSALDKQIQSKEVMLILNEVYGAVQNLDKQDDTFPLQQKLLICAFLLILNKGRNKEVTIAKVKRLLTQCVKLNLRSKT